MTKHWVSVVLVLLLLGLGTGCGLAGWHGDPSIEPLLKVTGIMDVKSLPERGSLWTIETDTATYVPTEDLPSKVKQESLRVSATGTVGKPPNFYPEGYYFDVRTISRLGN